MFPKFQTDECSCELCALAGDKRNHKRLSLADILEEPDQTVTDENSQEVRKQIFFIIIIVRMTMRDKRQILKIHQLMSIQIQAVYCTDCWQVVGRGIRHPCTKRDKIQNLHNLIRDGNVSEQVVSATLKEKAAAAKSTQIDLATGQISLFFYLNLVSE